jgi:hypothetical protein
MNSDSRGTSDFMLQIELPKRNRHASFGKSIGWSLVDFNDNSLPEDVQTPSFGLDYAYAFPGFGQASPVGAADGLSLPMKGGDAVMDFDATSQPLASMDYQPDMLLGALRPVALESFASQSKSLLEDIFVEKSPLDKVFPASSPRPDDEKAVGKPMEVVVEAEPGALQHQATAPSAPAPVPKLAVENTPAPASLPIVSAAFAVPAPVVMTPARLQAVESKRSRRKAAEPPKPQPMTYTKPVPAIFQAASNFNDPRDNEIVVGIYTRAERRAKILRYKQKRAKHVYIKGNQYECRRRFAVSRPRVGGRFTKLKNVDETPAAAAPAAAAKDNGEEEELDYAASDD